MSTQQLTDFVASYATTCDRQNVEQLAELFCMLAAAAKDERGRLLGTALAPTVAKQMAETFLRTAK